MHFFCHSALFSAFYQQLPEKKHMSAIRITHSKSLSLSTTTLEAKNFGLSEAEFLHLQSALQEGEEKLFERVFLAHFNDCMSYLIRKDDATHQEAYDITMDSFLHFRNLLAAYKVTYGNLRYLLTRMARQRLYRKRKQHPDHLDLTQLGPEIPDEAIIFTTEEFDLLSRAFKSLGQDCRELLQAFYFHKRSLKELAEEQSVSAPALRKRKSRCVATLKKYFHHLS